jgi:hypothetical protein
VAVIKSLTKNTAVKAGTKPLTITCVRANGAVPYRHRNPECGKYGRDDGKRAMTFFFCALALGDLISVILCAERANSANSGYTPLEAEYPRALPHRLACSSFRSNTANDKDFVHRPASKMSLTVPQRKSRPDR